MKPIHCLVVKYWLVPFAGIALACQLVEGNPEPRSRGGSSARPATTPKASPPEQPVAENKPAAATEEDPNAAPVPCAATEFNYPAVKSACAEGGRAAVKKVMHGAIANAKRAGTELKCSNCHVDQKTFGLKPNAVDDLKAWL